MVQVARERSGEEAAAASAFISWVTPEACLQLAMLADAAEENLDLTRGLDKEGFSLEDLSYMISGYYDRLVSLFTGDVAGTPNRDTAGCLTVSTGYTSHMLKLLRHPFLLNGQNFSSERGVPDATIRRCLGRMCNFVLLVKETLSAEFPNFETVQCYGVFRCVPGPHRTRSVPCSLDAAKLLAELHSVYRIGVSLEEMQQQFYAMRHVAERLAAHEGLGAGQKPKVKMNHV